MSDLERIPDWMAPDTTSGQIDLKAWAQEFRDVYQIAEALCRTPFVPREMVGKQADVAAAIMKGRELGLDPFDALGSIYIVHGRVGYYAEFMRRRIIQSGHTLKIVESTDSRCVIEGIRRDGGEAQRATFTAEQARKAGIDLGRYAADKLVARATSRLCRQVFPDVLSGTLIAEDLIDGLIPTDDAESAPPKPALTRKRATKPAKAAATQPAAQPDAQPAEETADDTAELLGDEIEPPGKPIDVDAYVTNIEDELTQAQIDADNERSAEQHTIMYGPAYDDDPTPSQEIAGLHEPITPLQRAKLMALLNAHGFKDHQSRIEYCSAVIRRPIESTNELKKFEASECIQTLEN